MHFPSPSKINDKIKKEIKESVKYLIKNHNLLKKYNNIEDFVLRDEEYTRPVIDSNIKLLKGCEYHLLNVRKILFQELIVNNYFLGRSVLDEVLFHSFANGKKPIISALEKIRDSGILHPGFVIYPLHSLGVIGGGILRSYTDASIDFFVPDANIVVTPQTNSIKGSNNFIENAAKSLGIKKRLPIKLLQHWRRSRPTQWLEKNPLLIIKINSYSEDYYENQILIINKIKLSTTILLMLNSLQHFDTSKEGTMFSSSSTNNWETLDIKHYFIFYPKPYKKKLTGSCVPMNINKAILAELSEVSAELDPNFWKRRIPLSQSIIKAIKNVEKGYYKHSVCNVESSNKGKVYLKIIKSLDFFHKSYRKKGDVNEAIVNLAVSFEILLTDNYASGIGERIKKRIKVLLKGVKGVRKLTKSIENLYDARSQYVHTGFVKENVEIKTARIAYIHIFIKLCLRLNEIPDDGKELITTMIINKK